MSYTEKLLNANMNTNEIGNRPPRKTLSDALKELLKEKKVCVCDIICKDRKPGKDGRITCVTRKTCEKKVPATIMQITEISDIEYEYGKRLIGGGRKNPHRDYIIRFALGFGLDYEETQELLRVADKSLLYSDVRRDCVIIRALACGYSIESVQATLKEADLKLLKVAQVNRKRKTIKPEKDTNE